MGTHSFNNNSNNTKKKSFQSAKVCARSLARLCAVQGVYQYEYTKAPFDILSQSFIGQHFCYYKRCFGILPDEELFLGLLKYAIENQEYIDKILHCVLKDKNSIKKIALVIIGILRIGCSEIFLFPQTDLHLITREYGKITDDLFARSDVSFVSALLSQVGENKNVHF
jgi:transcription termination factor NusB